MSAVRNNLMPKRKSLWMRCIVWLHLWPSLVSSVILVLVCLSGVIIVYGDEIIDQMNSEVKYASGPHKGGLMPFDQLLTAYNKEHPTWKNPGYVVLYKDTTRNYKMNIFDPINGLKFIYMNPYNSKIEKYDSTIHFFYITAHFHGDLLLGEFGAWLVAISTVIFTLSTLTGLVLWWPKRWRKSNLKQAFTIKWKAKFKRFNYDLHNVLGFYTLLICLVLGVTGLIIAFGPLNQATISLFGGTNQELTFENKHYVANEKGSDFNHAIKRLFKKYPWANEVQIETFNWDKEEVVQAIFSKKTGIKSTDGFQIVYIDKHSGKQVDVPLKNIQTEKIEHVYWSLHMGTWMTWFGKLCTFIGGLIATSLPITGFLIWWGKIKK